MAVGYPTDKANIDSRAGQLVIQLRDSFTQIENFYNWSTSQTDQSLIDRGYTSGEVAVLKSAYNDLHKLKIVYEGADTVGTAYDFRTFAHLLTGTV